MEELRQKTALAWSPGMLGLVNEAKSGAERRSGKSIAEIRAFIEARRWSYGIPEESLGEVMVPAQLADLGAVHLLESGDLEGAAALLAEGEAAYREASGRFQLLSRKSGRDKWKKLVMYSTGTLLTRHALKKVLPPGLRLELGECHRELGEAAQLQ